MERQTILRIGWNRRPKAENKGESSYGKIIFDINQFETDCEKIKTMCLADGGQCLFKNGFNRN